MLGRLYLSFSYQEHNIEIYKSYEKSEKISDFWAKRGVGSFKKSAKDKKG